MRIAICEDEIKIAEELKDEIVKMSKYISDKEVSVKIFTNSFGLLDYIESNKVDVIFMDIVLEKENGISLTADIQEKFKKVKIVFITGYINYVENVFDVKPFALLMKPITEERVRNMLVKLENAINGEEDNYITIENKEGIHTVEENSIIYVESDGRYINIFTQNSGKIRAIMTMSGAEEKFSHKLMKVHRSYMINVRKIKKLEKNAAIIENGVRIPISRGNYQKVYDSYMEYMKN